MAETKSTDSPGGETHNTETGVPADAHSVGFPPFDGATFPSQLLWLAITFGALYYVMSKVALPRIAGILEDRDDRIASDLDSAESLKRETDKAIAEYEDALAQARTKAGGIAQSTRETLNAEVESKRNAVEAELADKLAEAETRIATIKGEAMAEVGGIATETTAALMDSLLADGASQDEIAAAVAATMAQQDLPAKEGA